MALALFDRVQETTTTTGTGSVTLGGAVPGFQSFAVVGNGNTCYYTIVDGTAWEVGVGTYSTSGPTLARTTVLSNSSGNTSPITLAVGTKSIFLTYPAEKSVNLDGSNNVSPLGTVSSGVWQGSTVGVAYGGTGVTASSGANSVMLRDANQNVSINRLNQTSNTITASGGTTTLTAASAFSQILNGTGGQTFKLPDATTLTNTTTFEFNNNATGTLTITDYANATVGTVSSGGAAAIALLSNATVGGTWDVHAYIPESVTWGTNSLVLGGTVITGGTWNGGTIATGYGGTGLTTYTIGGAVYANSSSTLTSGTLPLTAGGTAATTASGARTSLDVPSTSGSGATGTWGISITGSASGSAGSVANAVTFNNGGSGDASGTTFNGSAARTISYNTVGAPSTSGTNASGTWGIGITGNAATATILKAINATSTGVSNWNPGGLTYQAWGQYFINSAISADSGDIVMWMRPSQYSGGGTELNMYIDGDYYSGTGAYKVLNAGNYNSYAPTLTGTGATGTWAINISGNAATATTATTATNQSGGTVSATTGSFSGTLTLAGTATNSFIAGTGDAATFTTYNFALSGWNGMAFYNPTSGGSYPYTTSGVVDFRNGIINMKGGFQVNGSTVLYAGNYNSYAPTLTGTGASGTWGISITGSAGSAGSVDFANLTNKGGGTGTYTTSGDYRAPIFYDSNDTAYYGDFASTSVFSKLTLNGKQTAVNQGIPPASGTSSTAIQRIYAGYSTYGEVMDMGFNVGTSYGWIQPTNYTNLGVTYSLLLNPNGGSVGVGVSNETPAAKFHVRAAPATSLGTLPSGVTIVSDSNTSNYLLFRNSADNGTYSGIAFQDNNIGGYVVFGNAGGGGDLLYVAGYGGGQLQYGSADSISPGARTTVASWNSTGLQINNGDMRAPIYYDSDNTAYYLNPNGTCNINVLTTGSYIDVAGPLYTRNELYILNSASSGWNTVITRNGGDAWIVYGGNSVRAPIFYDSNDTAYYCDPAGTSTLQVINSNGQDVAYSARRDVGASNWSARIVSRNYSYNVAAFLGNYNGYAGLFGHSAALDAWSPIYINAFGSTSNANVYLGNMYAPIFYDSNDSGYYLDPAGTSVLNVLDGPALSDSKLWLRTKGDTNHYLWNAGDDWEELVAYFGSGFRISSSAGYGTLMTFYAGGNGNYVLCNAGSIRAPIFYDSDNTGYYVDPASTSILNTIGFNGTSANAFGNYWAGGAGYPGYQFTGGNSRFGFSSTSGYVDVYTDGNFYAAIDLSGANRLVPVFDYNQGGGALYSSILYDTNDTSYYCDPNGTSRLNAGYFVNNITVSAGNTTGNGIILADDGDIVDLNDGYCSMRFSYGVRVFSANRGGSAQVALTYQGNVIAAGNVTAYGSPSDIRLKENVKPLTGALDKVLQLQGCTFDWKEDSEQHTMVGLREDIGFIADDVKDVVPNMVRMGQDGYLSLRDRGFSALLVEAMKEQQAQIAALRAEINALRAH